MKLGAFDFLIKTVDLENLEPVINRALEHILLKRRVSYSNEHEADQYDNPRLAHRLLWARGRGGRGQ